MVVGFRAYGFFSIHMFLMRATGLAVACKAAPGFHPIVRMIVLSGLYCGPPVPPLRETSLYILAMRSSSKASLTSSEAGRSFNVIPSP